MSKKKKNLKIKQKPESLELRVTQVISGKCSA